MIEKLEKHIGLVARRGIVGEGTAQVAESRGCDDLEACLAETLGEQKTLIETTTRAVEHHQRRPAPRNGVFERPGPGLEQIAAPGDTGVCRRHGGAIGAR
jgi:hypothetical protein